MPFYLFYFYFILLHAHVQLSLSAVASHYKASLGPGLLLHGQQQQQQSTNTFYRELPPFEEAHDFYAMLCPTMYM